jgi:hypothetical protein
MSDWRGETPEDRGNRKSKKMPVIPREAKLSGAKPDWRGNAGSSAPRTAEARTEGREWLGDAPETTRGGSGGFYRILILSGLLALIGFAGYQYYRWTRYSPKRVPLLTSISSSKGAKDLGEVPFAAHTIQSFESLDSRNVNVQRVLPPSAEYVLTKIRSNQQGSWIDQRFTDNVRAWNGFLEDGRVVGGGGTKNLTAFYINCFLVRDPSRTPNQWLLVSGEDDPFDGGGVPIAKLLEQISRATREGDVALVGLDLHMPSVVTNLGDLSFPADALQKAYEELAGQIQAGSDDPKKGGRIVLVLPCRDGQENWVAPELSATVFGHFFRQGIFEGFDNQELTLESFASQLNAEVSHWVLQHRQAIQEPLVLMDESTKRRAGSIRFFAEYGKVSDANQRASWETAPLQSRFEDLDRLWTALDALRNRSYLGWSPVRWDPMRFALLESLLLQMEDIAETTLQESTEANSSLWLDRVQSVERELSEAERGWKSERRVSLVESEIECRLGRNAMFSNNVLNGVAGSERSPSRDDRALALWHELRNVASQHPSQWSDVFNASLLQRFQDLGPLPTTQPSEWLELQWVRTLHQEIDWNRPEANEKASEAMARTLHALARLQELVCHPNRRALVGLDEEISNLDQAILRGVDHLVANEWDASIRQCQDLETALEELRKRKDLREQAMLGQDRALERIPHALATLLRLGREEVGFRPEELRGLMKELADALRQTVALEALIQTPNSQGVPLESQLASQVEAIHLRILGALKSLQVASDGGKHPEAIRNMRIALRHPFLDPLTRKNYHRNLVDGYANTQAQGSIPTSSLSESQKARGIAPAELVQVFIGALGSEGMDPFKAMALGDQRTLLKSFAGPSASNERRALEANSFRARSCAHAMVQRVLANPDKSLQALAATPRQRHEVDERNYLSLQRRRLYRAGWGDDPLQGSSLADLGNPPESLYFRKLAMQYEAAPESDLGRWSDLVQGSETAWTAAWNTLKALSLVRATREESEPQLARLELDRSFAWPDLRASIHQGIGLHDAPQNAPQNATALLLGNDTTASNKPRAMAFDPGLSKVLFLSLRGHRRIIPMDSQQAVERYATSFLPNRSPATLQATMASEKQYVIVLLDCSGSMEGSMPQAKDAVRSLLATLREQPGVASQIALVVFGVNVREEQLNASRFQVAKAGGKELKHEIVWSGKDATKEINHHVLRTQFMDLRKDFDTLEGSLDQDFVKPSLGTPLFDAIYAACDSLDELGPRERDFPKTIIVISDGDNDTVKGSQFGMKSKEDASGIFTYLGLGSNAVELRRRLDQSKADFYFFQVETSERGINDDRRNLLQGQRAQFASEVLTKYQGTKGNSQVTYKNFAAVLDALSRSFALPQIRIEYLDAPVGEAPMVTQVGESVPLPRQGKFRVSAVRADPEEVVSREPLELAATANESFQIRFHGPSGRFLVAPADKVGDSLKPLGDGPARFRDQPLDVQAKVTFVAEGPRLNVAFRYQSERANDPFLPRPKFAVARLSPQQELSQNGTDDSAILLSDPQFTRNPYPTAEFLLTRIGLPLQDGIKKPMQLDLWWSMELPEVRTTLVIDKDFDLERAIALDPSLKELGLLSIAWQETSLTIKRRSGASSERLLVLCPQASETFRRYLERDGQPEPREEVHEFRIESMQDDRPVELHCIKESDLDSVSRSGDEQPRIFHYRGENFRLRP